MTPQRQRRYRNLQSKELKNFIQFVLEESTIPNRKIMRSFKRDRIIEVRDLRRSKPLFLKESYISGVLGINSQILTEASSGSKKQLKKILEEHVKFQRFWSPTIKVLNEGFLDTLKDKFGKVINHTKEIFTKYGKNLKTVSTALLLIATNPEQRDSFVEKLIRYIKGIYGRIKSLIGKLSDSVTGFFKKKETDVKKVEEQESKDDEFISEILSPLEKVKDFFDKIFQKFLEADIAGSSIVIKLVSCAVGAAYLWNKMGKAVQAAIKVILDPKAVKKESEKVSESIEGIESNVGSGSLVGFLEVSSKKTLSEEDKKKAKQSFISFLEEVFLTKVIPELLKKAIFTGTVMAAGALTGAGTVVTVIKGMQTAFDSSKFVLETIAAVIEQADPAANIEKTQEAIEDAGGDPHEGSAPEESKKG